MCMCQLDTVFAYVSEKLTLSLCMNPQIPAATSQANRMTKQAKNCGRERKGMFTVYRQESVTEFIMFKFFRDRFQCSTFCYIQIFTQI